MSRLRAEAQDNDLLPKVHQSKIPALSAMSNSVDRLPPLIALQQAVGNKAVTALIGRRSNTSFSSHKQADYDCGILPFCTREDSPAVASAFPQTPVQRDSCCQECASGKPCASDPKPETVPESQTAQPSVQRTIGDGHDLTSPRLAGESILEACYDDEARLGEGAKGPPVVKIQQALIDLGYDLGPKNADGIYGPRTSSAVKQFKKDERLGSENMGDVGPGTTSRLNELFPPDNGTPPGTLPDAGYFTCAGGQTGTEAIKGSYNESSNNGGSNLNSSNEANRQRRGSANQLAVEMAPQCIFPTDFSNFQGIAPENIQWSARVVIDILIGFDYRLEVSYDRNSSWVNRNNVPSGIRQPRPIYWIEQAENKCVFELGKHKGTFVQPPPQTCPAALVNVHPHSANKQEECATLRDQFYKDWAKDGERLLRHEQYHVKLACVLAEVGNGAIDREVAQGNNRIDTALRVRPIVEQNNSRYQKMYDDDTAHGCNAAQQAAWESRIDGPPSMRLSL